MSAKKCKSTLKKEQTWDAASLNDAAEKYFRWCDSRVKQVLTKDGEVVELANPRPYTMEGLCCHLGIATATFLRWRKLSKEIELGQAARLVMQRIIANRVEGALDGRQHAGFCQFLLKNNDPENYRDKVEIANTVAAEDREMFEAWSQMWKTRNV